MIAWVRLSIIASIFVSRVPRVCSCCVLNFSISSLKRNSLCSASLVIRDKFFAMCSSVLSFRRFSLLPSSCLFWFISSRRLSLSMCTALSNSLILMDICSFFSPILLTMLFKASSNHALFSTSGVTSGGVTLSVPGSFVLVEIRALFHCLDVFSSSTSGSADALPSPMFIFSPVRVSEVFIFTKSLDWPDVFVSLLIVLTTPNFSMVLVPLLMYGSFSWLELLRLTWDPNPLAPHRPLLPPRIHLHFLCPLPWWMERCSLKCSSFFLWKMRT